MRTVEIAKPKQYIVKEYARVCSLHCLCPKCIDLRESSLRRERYIGKQFTNEDAASSFLDDVIFG